MFGGLGKLVCKHSHNLLCLLRLKNNN